ncbi:MAG: DUF4126 domain-containing protein [Vicinamibacteria bacterium]|nr:DUF4126 domain-containing protein [Vicinamibacteria bacterium]
MTTAPWSDVLPSLALAIALAACAGLRAWLPLFLAAALARLGWLDLNQSFAFLASNQALILFGAATLIEIAADKIPAVDHALDAASTVIRPLAGSLLAASVLGWIKDPLAALALGIVVGAPAAFVPHAAKASLRTVTSALTAGMANPILSFMEDVFTVVLFVLAVLVPVLVLVILLGAAYFASRRARRRRRRFA